MHILISLHTYNNTSKPDTKLRMSSIYPLYKYAQGICNNTKPLPVAGNNHDSFVINGAKTQEVKYIAEICVCNTSFPCGHCGPKLQPVFN